jgi:hypothetical protein
MATVTFTQKEQMAILGLGIAALVFAPKIGSYLGKQAVGTVTNIATGAVTEVGKTVGIPETNPSQCLLDMQAGRTWDASFSCDATTYLKYLLGQTPY